MADVTDRIAALTGAAVNEIIGPILVDTSRLYGDTGQVAWSTTVYNVRSLTAAGNGAGPISFSASDGMLSLAIPASLDWKFYAQITSSWPADRLLHWHSELAGNGPSEGEVSNIGGDRWYLATPPIGANGELVVDITAAGVQDPGEEWQLTDVNFWLFR